MKSSELIKYDTRNNVEHFRDVSFKPLHTGIVFTIFLGASVSIKNITETGKHFSMKFSGGVGYATRNNLEHFWDVAFNPLGFIVRQNKLLINMIGGDMKRHGVYETV